MLFQFAPAIEAGLKAGKYLQVFSKDGVPLSIARDAATGRIVGSAIGVAAQQGLSPFLAPLQLGTGIVQCFQTHHQTGIIKQGFQALQTGLGAIQSSLGVLQMTTAAIGVGTVATLGLSAVNLWQTLKLRKEIGQLKLDVCSGFIDLQNALSQQGSEIIQHLDILACETKLEQHCLELIKAYGQFSEAWKLVQIALSCDNASIRNTDLCNARQTLSEALAIYNNPQILEETSAAVQLRRVECVWLMEQAIVTTYQMQNELSAASDRLSQLQNSIRKTSVKAIESCTTEEELDFIFPELLRIHQSDLAVLESWQAHLDWTRSLPASELKLLQTADFQQPEIAIENLETSELHVAEPLELKRYRELKAQSNFSSLCDQMKLRIQPDLRQQFIEDISNRAAKSAHKVLSPSYLKKASNLTLANLYHYLEVSQGTTSKVTAA